MEYMILDGAGNAICAFDNLAAARATLQAIVDREPAASEELTLVEYDAQGHASGAHVAADFKGVAINAGRPCRASRWHVAARERTGGEQPVRPGGGGRPVVPRLARLRSFVRPWLCPGRREPFRQRAGVNGRRQFSLLCPSIENRHS